MKTTSRRFVRYGLGRALFRVLSVTRNDTVSCANTPLHFVEAVRVSDGRTFQWWVTDAELPQYV